MKRTSANQGQSPWVAHPGRLARLCESTCCRMLHLSNDTCVSKVQTQLSYGPYAQKEWSPGCSIGLPQGSGERVRITSSEFSSLIKATSMFAKISIMDHTRRSTVRQTLQRQSGTSVQPLTWVVLGRRYCVFFYALIRILGVLMTPLCDRVADLGNVIQ